MLKKQQQNNAIKSKTNDNKVSEKRCNFEKVGTFLFMYYQKINAISLKKCYPLYEQTMHNSPRKLILSLFPYSNFVKWS